MESYLETTRWHRAASTVAECIDQQIPVNLLDDPETSRRGRIITRFGLLGSIFGLVYAAFYLLIGHLWGAGIILLCTAGVAITPSWMRWHNSIQPAGHFFAFTLTLGFGGLCFVEGGVHGHAIAWLVAVPLCALILLGIRGAIFWVVIAFLAAATVIACDVVGLKLPTTYDPKWESTISAAGYLGLVVFMSILGLIFETGRARAYARLQVALQKLEASNERLTHLNQEKTEFLGIAAHDLKNPLTVIMTSGELLKAVSESQSVINVASKIITASERMRRLISDLLDANAIEEGRYASKLERCEISAITMQMVDQNMVAAQRKQIEIRPGMTEIFLRTDPAAAQQILDNLISNAVKYSPRNSKVYVHLVPEKDHAVIMVRDEGPGISEDDQKKLFQKFSRLTARPTGGESSTGLGLSIAKRLAQTLGGDILCQSTLGVGTTFLLRLPLDPAEASRPEHAHDTVEILREQATYSSHRN